MRHQKPSSVTLSSLAGISAADWILEIMLDSETFFLELLPSDCDLMMIIHIQCIPSFILKKSKNPRRALAAKKQRSSLLRMKEVEEMLISKFLKTIIWAWPCHFIG